MNAKDNCRVICALDHQRHAEIANGHLLADLDPHPARLALIGVGRRLDRSVQRILAGLDVLHHQEKRHQLRHARRIGLGVGIVRENDVAGLRIDGNRPDIRRTSMRALNGCRHDLLLSGPFRGCLTDARSLPNGSGSRQDEKNRRNQQK